MDQDLSAWLSEQLRVTSFIQPSDNRPIGEWWKTVAKEEPEVITNQKRLGVTQLEGSLDGGRLILRSELARVDWLLVAPAVEQWDGEGPPSLGAVDDVLVSFLGHLEGWFRSSLCPPSKRIALAGIALLPVPNQRSGYEKLQSFLRQWVNLGSEEVSDFVYQINRPVWRKVHDEELKVNRITKWSVGMLRQMQTHADLSTSSFYSRSHSDFFCRLEYDLNNAPSDIELAVDVQLEFLDVLRNELQSEVFPGGSR